MQCQDNTRNYAGFGVRLAAYIVDLLLVGCVTGTIELIAFIFTMIDENNIFNVKVLFDITLIAIIVYIIKASYFILMTYSSGKTLGKMIFKIEVIDVDGDRPSLWDIIYRETIGRYLSTVLFYIGYLIAIADTEKKTCHDMLADTRVVYTIGNVKKRTTEVSNTQNQFIA